MEVGPVRYAQPESGVNIAYRVFGSGPYTTIWPPSSPSHLEAYLAVPSLYAQWERRDTAGLRTVQYDQRGTGLSTRDVDEISFETMVADLDAVVRALELEQFVLWGGALGAPVSIRYAHDHPEMVQALIIDGGFAFAGEIPGLEALLALFSANWPVAARSLADMTLPSASRVEVERLERLFRAAADGATSEQIYRAGFFADVRPLLADLKVPTLVRHRSGARNIPDALGRELASRIPNAELQLLHWDNPVPLSEAEIDESARIDRDFLDGVVGHDDEPAAAQHATGFQTILFTDLEASTPLTQRLGDEGAQELLRGHNTTVRGALNERGGREVKHTGDGIMASFPSAVAAVTAALQIQRELAGGEVRVRVGLNAGEPIAEDDDLFGLSVIKAARVADRAEPGQVLVSRVVRELCEGKTFAFTSLGEVSLKGFSEAVELFEVSG